MLYNTPCKACGQTPDANCWRCDGSGLEPYEVFDNSGKAAEWLSAGKGICIWESHDIGAGRPDRLTPADVQAKPHWAYEAGLRSSNPRSFRLFHAVGTVKRTWSQTKSGLMEARKACRAYGSKEKTMPIGHRYVRHSVCELSLASKEVTLEARPYHIEFRYGVLMWSCIDKDCRCPECAKLRLPAQASPT